MPKWKPLKGIKVGHLTVLEDYRDDTKPKGNNHYCVCQCDCENKTIINVRANLLTSMVKLHCGCESNKIKNPLKGKVFGKLIVLDDYRDENKRNRHYCMCQCSCDNKTIISVRADRLELGNKLDCGCNDKNKKRERNIRTLYAGKVFGKLTVLEDYQDNTKPPQQRHYCKCKCNCENKTIVYLSVQSLKYLQYPNCGCENKWRNPLKDKKFGKLTVLEDIEDTSRPAGDRHLCRCICECGRERIVSYSQLIRKNHGTKSCGHCDFIPTKIGDVYGRLKVLEIYSEDKKAKCICMNDNNIVVVNIANLRSGDTQSCGCLQKERCTKHGMYNDRFYGIYYHIIQRCNNPNNDRYKDYGGKGVKCHWKSFEDFKNDMYDSYLKHFNTHNGDTSIDRIDVNGDYCKENCRWLTNREQQANKTCTQSIEEDGTLYSINWYCEKHNINYNKIRSIARNNNFTLKDALIKFLKEGNYR